MVVLVALSIFQIFFGERQNQIPTGGIYAIIELERMLNLYNETNNNILHYFIISIYFHRTCIVPYQARPAF